MRIGGHFPSGRFLKSILRSTFLDSQLAFPFPFPGRLTIKFRKPIKSQKQLLSTPRLFARIRISILINTQDPRPQRAGQNISESCSQATVQILVENSFTLGLLPFWYPYGSREAQLFQRPIPRFPGGQPGPLDQRFSRRIFVSDHEVKGPKSTT